MISFYLRRGLTCYHCARPAGYLVYEGGDALARRYQPERGERRPQVSDNGRLVCGHCHGPLYQGEAERVFPIEALPPEPPRKRGRPRKHPLPLEMPQSRAS